VDISTHFREDSYRMANIIEKNLPKPVRDQLTTVIAAAIGLFLGLQYNDYVKSVIERFLPDTNNLLIQGAILLGLTFAIVYLSVYLKRALDGK
jgi:hypothetical protein